MITIIITTKNTTITTTIMTIFPPSDSSLCNDSIFTSGVDNNEVNDATNKSNN